MKVTIHSGNIDGIIKAPSSKSVAQRALALAFLRSGSTTIHHLGDSSDELAALSVIESLGAKVVKVDEHTLNIYSTGNITGTNRQINIGESGLSARMFAPILALDEQAFLLTGNGSILERPMDTLEKVLQQMGVSVESNDSFLPLQIKGPAIVQPQVVDGSMSSQYVTGILMAYARACKKPVVLSVKNAVSKPYISLTVAMMNEFGFSVKEQSEGYKILPVTEGVMPSIAYNVEGDWSGAAFLLVAGAISGKAVVKNLSAASHQADKAIIDVLELAGAKWWFSDNTYTTTKSNLQAFNFDATDCPDLFPPLVALAAYCKGNSIIKGVSRLAHKESARAATLQKTFAAIGVEILLNDDEMIIKGGSEVQGASVFSHHDHRIAMAAAVAALNAKGSTEIDGAEAVNKSYPGFYGHLENCGIRLSYIYE